MTEETEQDLKLSIPLAVLGDAKGVVCIPARQADGKWRIAVQDRADFLAGNKKYRFGHDAECYYQAEIATRMFLAEMKDE